MTRKLRTLVGLALTLPLVASADRPSKEMPLDVHDFKVVERDSGPVNYYHVIEDPAAPYIHADYLPRMATTVLGYEISDSFRKARRLRWSWRAMILPVDGDECDHKRDSAATVYVTWRRGLRWYTIKYVWSTTQPKGTVCDKKRNPFVVQDLVVLQSGGPVGFWKDEEIDLVNEFRAHFADGDPDAPVPDLRGVGIMTDGDQTATRSAADFGKLAVSN